MSIEYAVNPKRLIVEARLEMEDGQIFEFSRDSTYFIEGTETVSMICDEISSDIYDKLDEFTVESDDSDEDEEDWQGEHDYDIPHDDDFVNYNEN